MLLLVVVRVEIRYQCSSLKLCSSVGAEGNTSVVDIIGDLDGFGTGINGSAEKVNCM